MEDSSKEEISGSKPKTHHLDPKPLNIGRINQDLDREEVNPSESDQIVLEEQPYNRLDPRIIKIWRIENLIWTLLVFTGTFAGSSALGWFTGFPRILVPIVWIVFGSIVFFFSFWWPPRLHKSWSYRADRKLIELRYGVFWHKSVMIPLSRVQHIDLRRGPLERRYELASLEIHTAGTQQASHKINGLKAETGSSLREKLIAEADLEIQ